MDQELDVQFVKSSAGQKDLPSVQGPEFAFIGRSNVGKSSLINLLARQKNLAKTSAAPGKTRLINHFSVQGGAWYLVDLPGYGYAKVSKDQREAFDKLIWGYLRGRQQLYLLFVLIDSRHEAQANDLAFINRLGKEGIPFALIFTKADKQSRSQTERNVGRFNKVLRKSWAELPPQFITSSASGEGRDELLAYIQDLIAGPQ